MKNPNQKNKTNLRLSLFCTPGQTERNYEQFKQKMQNLENMTNSIFL